MSENELQELGRFVPLLIPLVLIELALIVIAMWDLIKRRQTRGPKWLWVLIILLVNFIGPIVYLVVGRQDEA